MAASVRIALIILTASRPEHVQRNRATPRRPTERTRYARSLAEGPRDTVLCRETARRHVALMKEGAKAVLQQREHCDSSRCVGQKP